MTPTIFVPLESWETAFRESYSLDILGYWPRHNGPPRVKGVWLDGFPFTSTSGCFGFADQTAYFTAYRLIPASIYQGRRSPMTPDRDPDAAAGRREPFDLAGTAVVFAGREYVFGPHVNVRPSMPTSTCALPLARAQECAASGDTMEWRTIGGFAARSLPSRSSGRYWELFWKDGNSGIGRTLVADFPVFASSADLTSWPLNPTDAQIAAAASCASSFASPADASLPSDWSDYRAYYASDLPQPRSARRLRLSSLMDFWQCRMTHSIHALEVLRTRGLFALSAYAVSFYDNDPVLAYRDALSFAYSVFLSHLAMTVNLSLDLEDVGASV